MRKKCLSKGFNPAETLNSSRWGISKRTKGSFLQLVEIIINRQTPNNGKARIEIVTLRQVIYALVSYTNYLFSIT